MEQERCISCRRAFPRPVNFCPYCAARQPCAAAPEAFVEEIPDKTGAPLSEALVAGEQGPSPAVSVPVKDPPPQAASAQPLATATSPTGARPKSRAWLLALPLVLIAAGALYVWHSATQTPPPIRVTAVAGRWTPVDVNAVAAGSTLAVSGDGPFRIRSQSTAPILVDSAGTDLSSLDRGVEVEAANGGEVHVTLQPASGG